MRIPRLLVMLATLVAALGLSMAQSQTPASTEPSSPEEQSSLIRMDLLRLPQEEATPPLRNIFAPGTRASRSAETLSQGSRPWPPDEQAAETSAPTAESNPALPVTTVNLRYIGFIESPRRIIALVVFEGQAVAVVEGEVVGEGIRIGRITQNQVEIILPDSSTRLFSLEGE